MKIINQEFDKLYSDNRIITETLSNQTRILKTWPSSTSQDLRSLNELSESRAKELNSIINSTNINQQNLVVGNIITLGSMAVAELNEDLNMLINAINDGKHGIIHLKILTPAVLTSELRQIEEDSNEKYPIKLIPQTYQHIIDISEISINIINKRLVYLLKVLVLEHEDLLTLHLIPIPIYHGSRFLAPIPTHEIILVNPEKSIYTPSDLLTLQQCRILDDSRICKRVQPTYLISEVQNCETSIIRNSNKLISNHICQFSAFKISELAFIPLKDPNQYIIIPEHKVELRLCNINAEINPKNAKVF